MKAAFRKIGVVLAAASLAACGGASSAPADDEQALGSATANDSGSAAAAGPGERRAESVRVLMMGTSLTAGLGLDPGDAFPAVLQRKADSAGYAVRVVNAGLSGETSAGLLRRVDWLLREPADIVVIETGANDGLRAYDVDSTRANLLAIVNRVRSALPDALVLLVQMEAPPNLGPAYTSRFREMFPSVARETGIELVPFLLEGVAGVRALNQADGIHPNEEGAEIVAETVWQVLEPLLIALDRPLATG